MASPYFEDRCGFFNKSSVNSNYFHIKNPYAGIPQNLVTNLIGLLVLVVLFLLLRKATWSKMFKIVSPGELVKWHHLFFSLPSRISANVKRNKRVNVDQVDGGVDPSGVDAERRQDEASGSDQVSRVSDNEAVETRSHPVLLERSHSTLTESMSFWQWVLSIFRASDDDIEDRCGIDALFYLRLQRHVLLYLTIVTIISLAIILPINFQDEVRGDTSTFDHTTLVNLDPSSDLLWVHVCLSFLVFPIASIIMRKFSIQLQFQDTSLEINRTLMIDGVPKAMCQSEDAIRKHFAEAYPDAQIRNVWFAYDVSKLQTVYQDLREAKMALSYCQTKQNLGQPCVSLHPIKCSRCFPCICCCFVSKKEGNQFYSEQVTKLSEDFEREKQISMTKPLGIVFLALKSVNMAKRIYDSFQRPLMNYSFHLPESSVSRDLKIANWRITFAPLPEDIYWENLSVSRRFLVLKKLLSNLFVLILAFFLTTPEYLVSQSNSLITQFVIKLSLPSSIVDFLPTLMLWFFTAVLPLLVTYSDRWLGHWYRSTENHSIMKKSFFFLIFMVIVLPTFGLTTAQATLQFIFLPSQNETYLWECIFLPDSGAFFVNYVITAALIGAGLELIRFPDLIWYAMQIFWSRSRAELPAIQKSVKYEFRFGEQYARTMLLLNMTVAFSFSCPLISPFGLLYFLVKHYVDRHNLQYAYLPCKISKRVHLTAINFVMLSALMLQLFIAIFTFLRSGTFVSMMTRASIGLLLFSSLLYFMTFWNRTFSKCLSVEYVANTYIREEAFDPADDVYLPSILKGEGTRPRHKRRTQLPGNGPVQKPTNSRIKDSQQVD